MYRSAQTKIFRSLSIASLTGDPCADVWGRPGFIPRLISDRSAVQAARPSQG